jgi:lysozyme
MSAESIATGIIQSWELCRLNAYKPIPTDPWTIGWGATGSGITQGTVWTQEQADADLQNRVIVLGNQVRAGVKVAATDNQLAAMIDLAYNIGIEAFLNSTLLKLFNEGNTPGAGAQFLVWNESAGHVLNGLENRREAEQRVFFT